MVDYSYFCCICCLSKEERNAIAKNKEINLFLSTEQKETKDREIKLLLLGTGQSGKSTIIKQTRIILGKGFLEDVRRSYAKLVFQNICEDVRAMTCAMNTLKIPYSNPQNQIYAQWFQDLYIAEITQLQRSYVEAIHHLWADPGFKICYKRRREYDLSDSTEYFIGNLDRIAAEDYIPTCQDILRVQTPTIGINEYRLCMENIILRLVEVGGQRSERRKWLHCFNDVTSIIYVASLSEYDQFLVENSQANRMEESLALFNATIHSQWFENTSIILFLNKKDILAEKIQFSDLITYFPEFEGSRRDVHDAMLFIRNLYTQKAVSKDIYCHFICAMDTNHPRLLFNNIKDIILIRCLQKYKVF